MTPKDYSKHFPYDSITHKEEVETVAQNIMVILARTGNRFRLLGWEEYHEQRLKDGNFTWSEKQYFDQVVNYCASEEAAKVFCPTWIPVS